MEWTTDDWLNEQCGKIAGARSALIVLGAGNGQTLPAGVWPAKSRPPIEVYTAAQQTASCSSAVTPADRLTPAGQRIFVHPIWLGERTGGAMAIAIDALAAPSDDAIVNLLRPAMAQLRQILTSLQSANPASSHALRLSATLLSHQSFDLACTAFANEVADIFHGHRVSIGLSQEGHVSVMAISHGSGSITASEAFAEVEAAMEEAIDQRTTILYPQPKEAKARIVLAHAALAKGTQTSILTAPLVVERQIVGAITLECPADAAFSEGDQILLEHLIGLLAPLLMLKRRAGETAWQRCRGDLAGLWARLRAPGINRSKLLVGSLAGIVLLLTAVPVPYRVTAAARVEGEVQRVLAAPSDGFLQQVHARPGDEVKQEQALIELAQQDLLLEQRKWQGELAQHENSYGAAMAKGDRTQLAISLARMQEAQAQLGLVQQQLARSSLAAPFDGIVTEGDLAQSLGSPVKKGQVLMTVAPRGRYRIVVEVDESDITHVQNGQQGTLAPTARPGDSQPFVVSRIVPVATVILVAFLWCDSELVMLEQGAQ